jgi:hypothetical protein
MVSVKKEKKKKKKRKNKPKEEAHRGRAWCMREITGHRAFACRQERICTLLGEPVEADGSKPMMERWIQAVYLMLEAIHWGKLVSNHLDSKGLAAAAAKPPSRDVCSQTVFAPLHAVADSSPFVPSPSPTLDRCRPAASASSSAFSAVKMKHTHIFKQSTSAVSAVNMKHKSRDGSFLQGPKILPNYLFVVFQLELFQLLNS